MAKTHGPDYIGILGIQVCLGGAAKNLVTLAHIPLYFQLHIQFESQFHILVYICLCNRFDIQFHIPILSYFNIKFHIWFHINLGSRFDIRHACREM